jgi:UDP-N-acetylglucosamine 1-carboxyvinyltransferase
MRFPERYVIEGGRPLSGRVRVSGSKNGADYAMAVALLTADDVVIENVPDIADIRLMERILERLGATVERLSPSTMRVNAANVSTTEAPPELVVQLRASFLVMGALLGRFRRAASCAPGGDVIGIRPLDVHFAGFRALGATVERKGDLFYAEAPVLRGTKVVLDYPSVMGTLNVLLAASLAEGTTTIVNAAAEPEVAAVGQLLNAMGGRVRGAGGHTIVVEGVRELRGATHRVIPDRLEAGTFALAAAITNGDVRIDGAVPGHIDALLWKLREAGVETEECEGGVRVRGGGSYRAVTAQALPFPGLATDLQPQLAAFLTQARGVSVIHERVYDNRLLYVGELRKMGADIVTAGQTAIVSGPTPLFGTMVRALDVRAGAALVLAALAARGRTVIADVYHIERGYEALHEKLRSLGAEIERMSASD